MKKYTDENEIVVKHFRKGVVLRLIKYLFILLLSIYIFLVYYSVKAWVGIILGIAGIAISIPVIILSIYNLCFPTIVAIKENGINLSRKKRFFHWNEIQKLACKIRENKNGNENKFKQKFCCILNSGESFEANITKSNYTADKLSLIIKSRFPTIKCEYFEEYPLKKVFVRADNSSFQEEHTPKENKIVVEYSKSKMVLVLILVAFFFVLGIFCLALGFSNSPESTTLILGCILICGCIPLAIWALVKIRKPTIIVIDENGIYFASKNSIYPWGEIQNIECEYEKRFHFRFNHGARSNEEHSLFCVLNNGNRLKVDLTYSNLSAYIIYRELKRLFPNTYVKYNNYS